LQGADLVGVEPVEAAYRFGALGYGGGHENSHIVAFGNYMIDQSNHVNPVMVKMLRPFWAGFRLSRRPEIDQ